MINYSHRLPSIFIFSPFELSACSQLLPEKKNTARKKDVLLTMECFEKELCKLRRHQNRRLIFADIHKCCLLSIIHYGRHTVANDSESKLGSPLNFQDLK